MIYGYQVGMKMVICVVLVIGLCRLEVIDREGVILQNMTQLVNITSQGDDGVGEDQYNNTLQNGTTDANSTTILTTNATISNNLNILVTTPNTTTSTPIQAPPTPTQTPTIPAPPITTPPVRKSPNYFYCGRKILNKRRFPKQTNPRARQRLVSTNYDFDMYIDAKDSTVSTTIAMSGTWQPNYINVIGHFVKQGDKVLNLGSQSGLEALIMGKIIGSTGKLFIFEPYSFSNSLVTKNVEMNSLKDITTVYKIGASDEKSKATIQIAYYNTGGSQIVPTGSPKPQNKGRGRFNQEQEVDLDRVDALLPADVSLDFALLDVEKMQIKALKGMKGVIERSPNLVIMTEWQYARNPRRNKEQTLQLLRYMVDKGYKIYSYYGGNVYACKLGKFHEFGKIEDLLRIDFLDIFFIPKNYQWPK